MANILFEEPGGKYERKGDYLIPCIALPAEEEQPIGIWGGWASASGTQAANRPGRQARKRHPDYLKQYRKVTYTNLLTSGKLNVYPANIDRQAQERFERLIESMKQAQGITERLKEKMP